MHAIRLENVSFTDDFVQIVISEPLKTSTALSNVCARFYQDIGPLTEDRFLAPDLERAAQLVGGHDLLNATGIAFSGIEAGFEESFRD